VAKASSARERSRLFVEGLLSLPVADVSLQSGQGSSAGAPPPVRGGCVRQRTPAPPRRDVRRPTKQGAPQTGTRARADLPQSLAPEQQEALLVRPAVQGSCGDECAHQLRPPPRDSAPPSEALLQRCLATLHASPCNDSPGRKRRASMEHGSPLGHYC
jgi:hypothetical protein